MSFFLCKNIESYAKSDISGLWICSKGAEHIGIPLLAVVVIVNSPVITEESLSVHHSCKCYSFQGFHKRGCSYSHMAQITHTYTHKGFVNHSKAEIGIYLDGFCWHYRV